LIVVYNSFQDYFLGEPEIIILISTNPIQQSQRPSPIPYPTHKKPTPKPTKTLTTPRNILSQRLAPQTIYNRIAQSIYTPRQNHSTHSQTSLNLPCKNIFIYLKYPLDKDKKCYKILYQLERKRKPTSN
jgi:hypothetical protein